MERVGLVSKHPESRVERVGLGSDLQDIHDMIQVQFFRMFKVGLGSSLQDRSGSGGGLQNFLDIVQVQVSRISKSRFRFSSPGY